MLRPIILALLLLSGLSSFGQSGHQEIALEGALEVHIHASFSSVSVTTGSSDLVSLNHVLTVDGREQGDLRKLRFERENGILTIREILPTVKAMKMAFPDPKGGVLSGAREGGAGVFNDVMVNSLLEVVVPEGIKVTVETDYGNVTTTNLAGLVSASATYGNVDVIYTEGTVVPDLELYSSYGTVDVTLPKSSGANLDLQTRFGELMTSVDINVDKALSKTKEFYERVVGTLGTGGALLKCEAPYGDVYLREGE